MAHLVTTNYVTINQGPRYGLFSPSQSSISLTTNQKAGNNPIVLYLGRNLVVESLRKLYQWNNPNQSQSNDCSSWEVLTTCIACQWSNLFLISCVSIGEKNLSPNFDKELESSQYLKHAMHCKES